MLLLIKYTLLYGIVLMLVALGGMFSEHSGIINIALEGIMVIGGVAGVLTLTMLPANLSPFLTVLISVLVAALAGVVYSLLLAFASINLKADQTIGGTALNLLATAIAVVIAKYFSDSGSAKLNYSNKPFLFSIGGLELSIFVPLGIVLLIISYVVLYKTRFGLRLRACGEHPQAADSVGINVYKMRYAGVLISGALGAIGGMAYIVPPVQTWNFELLTGVGAAVALFGDQIINAHKVTLLEYSCLKYIKSRCKIKLHLFVFHENGRSRPKAAAPCGTVAMRTDQREPLS